MITFFQSETETFAVETKDEINHQNIKKLEWLFSGAIHKEGPAISGSFLGARSEMVSPWSTNAVEIAENMGLNTVSRIEKFKTYKNQKIDKLLENIYEGLDQDLFTVDLKPEPIREIESIGEYNKKEGLALSKEEVEYLESLSVKLNRKLTDGEVYGFSQVNSEHCRHKIFNGTFIIDGKEKSESLFSLIKKTSKENPNSIISAYKDNVAFTAGPNVRHFAPKSGNTSDFYDFKNFDSVISLKAETHNFPTTVEPFNGAATGSGGEIRDRLAGGIGSTPLAGTAVYMTPYARVGQTPKLWEEKSPARPWLYQSPLEILIKASNGASDFGNKYGQPLINGSLLTFEHTENGETTGYDKVIMQAGGIGFANLKHAKKNEPKSGDKVVIMGGDNYRIGMGGAAVSSLNTGETDSSLELNAVQRSNPEMQKRVANAIRSCTEMEPNPIVSIHDHGAGGHLNCLSELMEDSGGKIDIDQLPVGDPTLSLKEIIGNESQERMGLVVQPQNIEVLKQIADRERSPFYVVGEVDNSGELIFEEKSTGKMPVDLKLEDLFGSTPKTILEDETSTQVFEEVSFDTSQFNTYLKNLLPLESVACKDWLTSKVDRCVTGRVAQQQTVGTLQLPLANCGVMALDYEGTHGVATSLGHAPIVGLIDPAAGSRNAIAESLTNLVWAPLEDGLKSVSLSANWMWPCKNKHEDARLYAAVEAVSDLSIALGINVPTGKDSLSMKQQYPDGQKVLSPGTVIISASGHCDDIKKVVTPVARNDINNTVYYLNFSKADHALGGSAFAQITSQLGKDTPDILDAQYFKNCFNTLQGCIREDLIVAGHDVGSGGLITTLLEMCFPSLNTGMELNVENFSDKDVFKFLFSENVGAVFQVKTEDKELIQQRFDKVDVQILDLGNVTESDTLKINQHEINVSTSRTDWRQTSHDFEKHQNTKELAEEKFKSLAESPLAFNFPTNFDGKIPNYDGPRPIAAVLRDKGCNSEREMAYILHLAGFEVKDVHVSDLISGRENLSSVQFLVAVGGFSNSDVLGSAKGWAGAILYNEKAKQSIEQFLARPDTLSLGVCNGCQLLVELANAGMYKFSKENAAEPKLLHNASGRFECQFSSVDILENNSVLFSSMEGSTLGIWSAHGEGQFQFEGTESDYNLVGKYHYDNYPACPNGSDFSTAMITSNDGRHTATMPHFERASFPWNWAHYPNDRNDEISPWIESMINAREWCVKSQ